MRAAAALDLKREHGCRGALHWRWRLPPESGLDRLAAGLARRGYRQRACDSRLAVWRHPDGHEIVVVPGSGRVQIRLDYLTPRPERDRIARHLLSHLRETLEGRAANVRGQRPLPEARLEAGFPSPDLRAHGAP